MSEPQPRDSTTTKRGALDRYAEALGVKQSALLSITQGEGVGRQVELKDTPLIVGRSSDADLRLLNRSVSRLHCRVWRDSSGYWLRDLNSTNKTYLNDRPVVEARLKDGDNIMVGGTVLQFVQRNQVPTEASAQLYQMVVQDQLTGLYNRRYFEEALDQEISRSKRKSRRFVLAMVDIDALDRINQSVSQAAGDEVLRQVARMLRGGLRPEDVCTRFQAEEFAVLMPESTLAECAPLLQSVRSAVAGSRIHFDGKELQCTVSIGLVEWNDSMEREELVIKLAAEVRRAKQLGKNRISYPGQI
jgi:diguanylate cyclase (GGDEF)-like protein